MPTLIPYVIVEVTIEAIPIRSVTLKQKNFYDLSIKN
jgi:hypothetical protein